MFVGYMLSTTVATLALAHSMAEDETFSLKDPSRSGRVSNSFLFVCLPPPQKYCNNMAHDQ